MNTRAKNVADRTALQGMRETLRFIKDPLGTLVYLRETWGDVVPLPLPGARVVQFTSPEQVGALLRLPIKDETTRSMRDIMGHGLLTGDGPEWRRNRRMITPAFSQKAVAPFFGVIRTLTDDWIDRVKGAERELDMTEEMLRLTLDVILKTVFGGAVDIDRESVARGMEEYFVQFALDNAGWRRLVPRFIVTPGRRRRIEAMRELDEIVYRSIAQRRQGAEGSDLLYFMLQARDEQGQPLADSALRDEVLTLVLAGHETTAETLTYALWLLAQRREIQSELHDEVSAAIAAHGMTREAVMACKLLNAVLDETLRLYPPAYIVAREAHEDCEIGGYAVEKGTQLLAPAWAIHRDERWWKQPEQFRPERWLNGETSGLPPNAYFPFGGGPRLCIGKHFAKFEASVVLMALVHELAFQAVDSYQLTLMPSVTLRPREGIRLKVSTRTSIIGEELHHEKVREAPGAHAGHAHSTELR
jgi:cytochrome P450